jgi:DME family drug/metabolite transporter
MSKGSLFIIIQSIMIGVISIFTNALYSRGFTPAQASGVRIGLSAIFFFIFTFMLSRESLKIRLKDIWLFIVAGAGGLTLLSTLYMNTIKIGGAAIAVILLYTEPIIVMIASSILFKEKITPLKLTAIIMTVIGICLISGIIGIGAPLTLPILLSGLGSSIAYSLFTIVNRVALNKYSSTTVSVYDYIFAAITLGFVTNYADTAVLAASDPSSIPWCFGLSIFCCAIPFFLYNKGLENLETSKAAILSCVEPAVGTLTGILIFHESMNPMKVTGMLLIIAAVIILNLNPRKTAS